jgi:hypothetical protein
MTRGWNIAMLTMCGLGLIIGGSVLDESVLSVMGGFAMGYSANL